MSGIARTPGPHRIVRTMACILGGIVTAFLGCGGKGGHGSGDGGPSAQPPNPCATMNGTYSAVISEQPGGTYCPGNVPSPFCEKAPCEMNVNADGTINLPANMTCASLTVTGCTTRGSDCVYTSNGYSFTENFETTFAESGSAATGTISITGTGNGRSCSSSANVAATRL